LVLADAAATLANKTLVDATTLIQDDASPTKLFRFEASAITAGNTRVYTTPDQDTTLVGTDTTDTLTNKTITATSNTITANSLRTATASVDGSASTQPPGAGYVPTSLGGGTTFDWVLATVGTVESVGLVAPVDVFSVSNSPVVGTGDLTLEKVSQAAKSFYATPTGMAGLPVFREIVIADIPNIPLATHVTGILPVANGGTNTSTLTGNRVMQSNAGGTAIIEAPALTNGQLLIGSTGAAPVAATLTEGAGITITEGAGSVTIAASGGGSSTNDVLLFNGLKTISSASQETIAYFTWETARYSSLATARIVLSLVTVPSNGNSQIRLNSGGNTLSIVTVGNGAALGFHMGSLFDPSLGGAPLAGNPMLEVTVERNGNQTTEAQVAGIVLQLG
jgi:hypothetical protein